MKRSINLFLLLAALVFPLGAQNGVGTSFDFRSDQVTYTIDWINQRLLVEIERSVPSSAGNAPAAVSRTQSAIRRDFRPAIVSVLLRLRFDETGTVETLVTQSESLIQTVREIAASATAVGQDSDPDLLSATVTYSLDLGSDVAAAFVTTPEVEEPPQFIGWSAAAEYTGLIIYAPETLMLFGTSRIERLSPALFPRIWFLDEQEREIFLLLDRSMVEPRALEDYGMVLYHSDPDALAVRSRVGENPMRVLAVGGYGMTATDPILEIDDARRLLSLDANRQLLREGRIAVILSPDRL